MNAPIKTLLQSVAGTVLFAGVHSLLASHEAKRVAASTIGLRRPNSYRLAYNAQAIATFGGLCVWLRRLPNDELVYEIRGPLAYAMRAGQGAAAVQLARSLYAVGF